LSDREFARISGVGEVKRREFGAVFLAEVAAHLQSNPRQIFADDSFAAAGPAPGRAQLGNTARETLRLFRAGASAEEIATTRMLTTGTIYGHLAEAVTVGESIDVNRFLTQQEQQEVSAAFQKIGFGNLSSVFEFLGGRYDYGKLRIFRAAAAVRAESASSAH
jgi:ATP-dependent DNA helicase RecQ